MGCPAEVEIGKDLVFSICTHDPIASGTLTDADSLPPFIIFEDNAGPQIASGTMAKLADNITTGFYTNKVNIASGTYDHGKTYSVYIEATVNGIKGGISYEFIAYNQRKSDLRLIDGDEQSQIDLKDFADAGYDPSTNKVQGVVLVDTCTANTDLVTANNVRDAILDDATRFSGANIDAAISSRSSHTAANVWAVGTRTLTSFGTLVADIATAVWGAVTRTLTAATNITSDGNTIDQTQLANLDATISSRSSHTANNVRDAILTDSTSFNGADIPAIKTVTDILNGLIENVSGNRFTTKALEQAPTGGGDATEAKQDLILGDLADVKGDPLWTDESLYGIAASLNAAGVVLTAINSQTTQMNFTGSDINATLDGETVTVGTNNDKTGYALSTAGIAAIFASVIETGLTFLQYVKYSAAVLFGKSSGGGTTTIRFRNTADTVNRISATVDSNENRTAVSRDDT
jgi:hypothetical protein